MITPSGADSSRSPASGPSAPERRPSSLPASRWSRPTSSPPGDDLPVKTATMIHAVAAEGGALLAVCALFSCLLAGRREEGSPPIDQGVTLARECAKWSELNAVE